MPAGQPAKGPGSRQTTSERFWKGCSHPRARPPQPSPQPRDSRGSHLPQAEEGRCELVANKAPGIGVQVPPVDGQPFCNVPQLGSAGFRPGPLPPPPSPEGLCLNFSKLSRSPWYTFAKWWSPGGSRSTSHHQFSGVLRARGLCIGSWEVFGAAVSREASRGQAGQY